MLRARTTEPEYFDSPARRPDEIVASYRELARVNRLCRFADPYTRVMSRWLGAANCRQLSILDLGAGDGSLGAEMEQFARRQDWNWQVTNFDLNPVPLRLASTLCNVAGSVLALPFVENSFDVVVASQMTHHLADGEEVVRHLREAWRVARRGVFITDMTRGPIFYAAVWLMVHALRLSPAMRADGLLSVKRSWTRAELAGLAARSGIPGVAVHSYFGTRLIVFALKTPATAAASGTSAACRAADESCFAPRGR